MPPENKEERTEKPTPKRLSDAKKKGSVPQSQDMTSAVSLIVLATVTFFMGPRVVGWSMGLMREAFSCNHMYMSNPEAVIGYVQDKFFSALVVMAPFFGVLMVTGIATHICISGWNFSTETLQWKFSQINPISGFKKLFSVQSLVKLGLSVLKMMFVGIIAYDYVRTKIVEMALYQWTWGMGILTSIAKLILGVIIRLCVAILIIGIIDLVYQKWQYIKNLMMTKKEVKDEMRNSEGPPEVKKKIRQKQFEAALRRMMQEVPKADVVLVNPDHVAVALKYDPGTMHAPTVVAKGGDNVCEKIKEIARAYGVPIIRRPALARTLFGSVKLGEEIPDALFVAVAEVLALVHRLRANRVR